MMLDWNSPYVLSTPLAVRCLELLFAWSAGIQTLEYWRMRPHAPVLQGLNAGAPCKEQLQAPNSQGGAQDVGRVPVQHHVRTSTGEVIMTWL